MLCSLLPLRMLGPASPLLFYPRLSCLLAPASPPAPSSPLPPRRHDGLLSKVFGRKKKDDSSANKPWLRW